MAFIIFCMGVFLVEMFLSYGILYLLCYKIIDLQKIIKDDMLVWILIILSAFISYLLFFPVLDFIATYIFDIK